MTVLPEDVVAASRVMASLSAQFVQSMIQLGIAMEAAARQFADALIPTWERFVAKTRAWAYGSLRSWGVPHWIARLVARRCPFWWALWIADRGA